MTKEELISDLKDLFGEDNVITKESRFSQLIREFLYPEHNPLALVKPIEIRQLNRLLMLIKRHKICGITPRGFGNTFGAYSRDVIVDLTNFNEILEIDESRYTTTVQTGLVFNHFSEELKKKNLKLPLAPVGNGTIGGFIAYNGFGIGSYKYGSIRNYLRGVTLLTSKKLVKLGTKNTPPFTSGYNFTDILAGSMGFFGIIIDVTLGLIPTPELHYDISLTYETIDDPNIENCMKILNSLKTLNSLSNLTIITRSTKRSGEPKNIEIEFLISLEGSTEMVQGDNEKLYSLKDIKTEGVDNLYISDQLKYISENLIYSKPFLMYYNDFKESWYKVKDYSIIGHFLSPNECIFAIIGPSDDRDVKERVYECSKEAYFSKENLPLIKKMKILLDPHNLFQRGMLD
ncbi:MAG: FAD-binding oxidoreductase [Candidatus Helarchaeota archaeon]|nr:FAD-binding oxidoreductase [Candidatus Helarchaeota archaeon]